MLRTALTDRLTLTAPVVGAPMAVRDGSVVTPKSFTQTEG